MTSANEAATGTSRGFAGLIVPYVEIFRVPHAWRFSVAGIIGRMPMSMVGLGTVLLSAVLGFVFSLGVALLDLIRNPVLGLTQPLLALLALALLVWPRQLIPQRSTPS